MHTFSWAIDLELRLVGTISLDYPWLSVFRNRAAISPKHPAYEFPNTNSIAWTLSREKIGFEVNPLKYTFKWSEVKVSQSLDILAKVGSKRKLFLCTTFLPSLISRTSHLAKSLGSLQVNIKRLERWVVFTKWLTSIYPDIQIMK